MAGGDGYLYTREDLTLVSICAIIKWTQAIKLVKWIINDFWGSDGRFEGKFIFFHARGVLPVEEVGITSYTPHLRLITYNITFAVRVFYGCGIHLQTPSN